MSDLKSAKKYIGDIRLIMSNYLKKRNKKGMFWTKVYIPVSYFFSFIFFFKEKTFYPLYVSLGPLSLIASHPSLFPFIHSFIHSFICLFLACYCFSFLCFRVHLHRCSTLDAQRSLDFYIVISLYRYTVISLYHWGSKGRGARQRVY